MYVQHHFDTNRWFYRVTLVVECFVNETTERIRLPAWYHGAVRGVTPRLRYWLTSRNTQTGYQNVSQIRLPLHRVLPPKALLSRQISFCAIRKCHMISAGNVSIKLNSGGKNTSTYTRQNNWLMHAWHSHHKSQSSRLTHQPTGVQSCLIVRCQYCAVIALVLRRSDSLSTSYYLFAQHIIIPIFYFLGAEPANGKPELWASISGEPVVYYHTADWPAGWEKIKVFQTG